jgi:hypothetical protein
LTDRVDVKHNPCIIASGIIDDIDPSNFTFSLNPSQYMNLPRAHSDCPLSCFFDPDSKKWKTKKPMPTTGSVISVIGFLTKIKCGFDHNLTFQVELDNIAYLNRSAANPNSMLQGTVPSCCPNRRDHDLTSSISYPYRFSFLLHSPPSSIQLQYITFTYPSNSLSGGTRQTKS